jgi:small subunit ribosomal protein S4
VKKGLAKTQKQARQFIVHRQVIVGGRAVRWPSMLVSSELEGTIDVSQKIKSKSKAE